MITRVFILLTLMISISLSNAQEIVKKVSFSGEKLLSPNILYNRVGRIYQPDSLASDSLKIVSTYQQNGWFDCRISLEVRRTRAGLELVYHVDKNNRYLLAIDSINSNLPDNLLGELLSIISLYENKPATSYHLDNLADEIIKIWAANGYPYCEVHFADLRLQNENHLAVTPDIRPGPRVIVERVDYPGRKNLDIDFLQSYTGLIPPFEYSTDRFKLVQRRLSRSGFLSEVDNFELRYLKSPERGVVVFPIKEVSPLLLDGALGYSSNDNDFYGRFNAVIANILGKGRRLEFDWAKKDRSSRWLKLGFAEPYPLGLPFRLELEAYQDDRDSLFIETGGEVGLRYISSDIYSYGGAVGVSQVNPEAYGRTLVPHKNRLKLSVSFTADTRDYPVNPRTGDYLFLKGDFISETTREDSLFAAVNVNYRVVEFKLAKYLPLTGSSILYAGVTAKGDFSDNIPIDRLFPLGGFGSLRGYNQDIFFISRQATGTVEYRLLTSRAGRAYIFSDMAVFQVPRATGEGSETKYKAGFGIGLAAAVKPGITTIEIAVPHSEGLSAAKLHFGIRTGF